MDLSDLKTHVAEARELMERGRLAEALDALERFYQETWFYEDRPTPEFHRVMASARKLAGEIRGRMAELVLSGARLALAGTLPGGPARARARQGIVSDLQVLVAMGAIDQGHADRITAAF